MPNIRFYRWENLQENLRTDLTGNFRFLLRFTIKNSSFDRLYLIKGSVYFYFSLLLLCGNWLHKYKYSIYISLTRWISSCTSPDATIKEMIKMESLLRIYAMGKFIDIIVKGFFFVSLFRHICIRGVSDRMQ